MADVPIFSGCDGVLITAPIVQKVTSVDQAATLVFAYRNSERGGKYRAPGAARILISVLSVAVTTNINIFLIAKLLVNYIFLYSLKFFPMLVHKLSIL
jgi:hypothetical protein